MEVLELTISILFAFLLIALIVLTIKLYGTIDRVNASLDEILIGLKKLNPIFNFIDITNKALINFKESFSLNINRVLSFFKRR